MYCKWNVTFYSSHQQTYFWQSPHGPSSECPSCPSFSSSDASTWRWPRPQNAPRCWAVWKIPRVAGPLRAEWLMTSKMWCWFEVISSSMKKCGAVSAAKVVIRFQKRIETVYGLESLIGCFHCKCYFGESLAAGNLASAFVQHDTVPGEECIFTRGHRSSRA